MIKLSFFLVLAFASPLSQAANGYNMCKNATGGLQPVGTYFCGKSEKKCECPTPTTCRLVSSNDGVCRPGIVGVVSGKPSAKPNLLKK